MDFQTALAEFHVLENLNITLAEQQLQALEAVFNWYMSTGRSPFFYLAGFAGSGKSTIAKVIAALIIWLQGGRGIVKYACATGKAARVLTRKGSPASTCHAMIYLPLGDINEEIKELETALVKITNELKNAESPPSDSRRRKLATEEEKIYAKIAKLREPRFQLNEIPLDDASDDEMFEFRSKRVSKKHPLSGVTLLVLDEVSLLNEEIANDLMKFKIPMLVLGDPGQLSPVKGTGYFTEREPNFMLTEIHRQAADNPIIKLATTFREGKTPACGVYGESRVTTRFKLQDKDFLEVDQILCGANNVRTSLNKKLRELQGFEGVFPKKGERLICRRNNKKDRIYNGQIFIALDNFDEEDACIKLIDDENEERLIYIHRECFTRPTQVAAWDYRRRSMANEFDFAYCITAHVSQGSEWDRVLVFGDALSWMKDPLEKRRWAYTSCTRAAKSVLFAL